MKVEQCRICHIDFFRDPHANLNNWMITFSVCGNERCKRIYAAWVAAKGKILLSTLLDTIK